MIGNVQFEAVVKNGHYLFENGSMYFDFPVEIHIARFELFKNSDVFKVYMNFTEPITSPNRELIETVIENRNRYDLILTTDVEILKKCSNSILFPYGTTWLNKGKIKHLDGLGEYDSSLEELHNDKRFEISFLCTNHARNVGGYLLRRNIWERKEEISTPTLFYSSTRFPMSFDNILPEDDKKYLFNSQFHIAIESSSVKNYFSEKLIDALVTKTVPIYWGCPNIGDFFDVRGMIIVNEKNIVDKCNNITPDTYESMLPYIWNNYRKAIEYARPLSERVKEKINEEKENVNK